MYSRCRTADISWQGPGRNASEMDHLRRTATHIGAGPIKLGLSREEVRKVMGAPFRTYAKVPVYGSDGHVEGAFLMGDGIADVQSDDAGNIWTSYFDEGIFGNNGWNEPVGAPGLLCFDSTGRITWHFQPPQGFDSLRAQRDIAF